MYEIEHGIEKPRNYRRGVYPFRDMRPGDSFFVPSEDTSAKCIRASAYHQNRKGNGKFTARTVDGGFRVWRLA